MNVIFPTRENLLLAAERTRTQAKSFCMTELAAWLTSQIKLIKGLDEMQLFAYGRGLNDVYGTLTKTQKTLSIIVVPDDTAKQLKELDQKFKRR